MAEFSFLTFMCLWAAVRGLIEAAKWAPNDDIDVKWYHLLRSVESFTILGMIFSLIWHVQGFIVFRDVVAVMSAWMVGYSLYIGFFSIGMGRQWWEMKYKYMHTISILNHGPLPKWWYALALAIGITGLIWVW